MGKKQVAVGVYQPPLGGDLFGAEKSAGLQLRPLGPAAVLVPIARAGLSGEFCRFGCAMLLQLCQGMGFSGPVLVLVLAEGIDEGKKRVGIVGPGGRWC